MELLTFPGPDMIPSNPLLHLLQTQVTFCYPAPSILKLLGNILNYYSHSARRLVCSYSRSEEGCMPMSTVRSTADLNEFKSDPLARNLTLKKCQQKITTFDLKIKYHPEIITATEEHPFYVR